LSSDPNPVFLTRPDSLFFLLCSNKPHSIFLLYHQFVTRANPRGCAQKSSLCQVYSGHLTRAFLYCRCPTCAHTYLSLVNTIHQAKPSGTQSQRLSRPIWGASCEDPSIPAKNRGESTEDTRIVRFIWAQKGEWCRTRTNSGQASGSHTHTLKNYSRKIIDIKNISRLGKMGFPPSLQPSGKLTTNSLFLTLRTERESRHIFTRPL